MVRGGAVGDMRCVLCAVGGGCMQSILQASIV